MKDEQNEQCAACRRSVNDGIKLYKYEFGQKPSYFNYIEGAEIINTHYAMVYLCSTDYTLAGRIRKEVINASPADVITRLIEYRNLHPIKTRRLGRMPV
jgi:hypothetical protein